MHTGARRTSGRLSQYLCYRPSMKKPTAKLVVRRETVRALTGVELTRAVGGDAILLAESDIKHCTQGVPPPAG